MSSIDWWRILEIPKTSKREEKKRKETKKIKKKMPAEWNNG